MSILVAFYLACRGIWNAFHFAHILELFCSKMFVNTSISNKFLMQFLYWSNLVEEAGGKCLACAVDIRNDGAIQSAMKEAADKFGGIDILVNNASAISLTGTAATDPKRFDLMMGINARGTYMWSDWFHVLHFDLWYTALSNENHIVISCA